MGGEARAPRGGRQVGWMLERIDALDALLRRDDYRGHDPFDLPNSPLLPIPEHWARSQLVVSKFGSRIAPDWLRRALRVPLIEDPKTYACCYFAYKARGQDERAAEMTARIARLASPTWGYEFTWATRTSGVSRRRASTLVPGSFAIFALAHELAAGETRHRQVLERAAAHYAEHHRSLSTAGPFLSYFPGGITNTHNANVLGCLALSLSGVLLGQEEWLALAATCTQTTAAAVEPGGYLRYAEHASGDWTDCFHHLYVMASLQLVARLNPHANAALLDEAVGRLRRYLRQVFVRGDGLMNYYPDRLYPIDPHNYAAAAIYAAVLGTPDDIPPDRAEPLLARVDELMWDRGGGRYRFRRHRRRTDGRYFVRWTQAWMFTALSVVAARETGLRVPAIDREAVSS